MREVRSARQLWDEARDAFLVHEHFLYWRIPPDLAGYVVWGRPNAPRADELVAVLRAELELPPHAIAVVADFSFLEHVDHAAFQRVIDHGSRHAGDYLARRRAQAVVRPDGLVGSVVAGFYDVSASAFPHAVFSNYRAALAWLERLDVETAVGSLVEQATVRARDPVLLTRLRRELDADLGVSLKDVAARMGMAARTLQHRLDAAGTSFRQELHGARLQRAQAMLVLTDEPIGVISLEIGYSTPQHFNDWFRIATGSTPGEWRRERRRT